MGPHPAVVTCVSLSGRMMLSVQLKHLPTSGNGLPTSLLLFQVHLGVTMMEWAEPLWEHLSQ